MDIIVRGQHFSVPEQVETRARAKLTKLEHFFPLLKNASCEVDITHEKAKEPHLRFVVHVTVSDHGVHLQATERAEQPETAIDHAAQVLSRQARRQKGRLYRKGRRGADAGVPAETGAEAEAPAKVKRFPLKPMTVTEAIEQLEALGHDFFIFHHADEERVAVLYRRHAGDYGMIVPELP